MTEVVIECRGQVDKYLGDGVMAFWGAPVRLASPARAACEAALKMRARFDRRRKVWEKSAGTGLVFRSGLDVGETLVGEMGTEHRISRPAGRALRPSPRRWALARNSSRRRLSDPQSLSGRQVPAEHVRARQCAECLLVPLRREAAAD